MDIKCVSELTAVNNSCKELEVQSKTGLKSRIIFQKKNPDLVDEQY